MTDLEIITKECTRCHQVLPLSQFYKSKGKPDGHNPHCITCVKAYVAEYSERKRQEMGDEAYLSWRREHTRRHRETHGWEKEKARTRARVRATNILIAAHRKEFDALYRREWDTEKRKGGQ